MNFKEPEGQLARWLQVLSEYQFDIIHRPGKQHGNADGLSRRSCRQCGCSDITKFENNESEKLIIRLIALQTAHNNIELADLQQKDNDIASVYAAIVAGAKPSVHETTSWSRGSKS